jgi:hypothetical protein
MWHTGQLLSSFVKPTTNNQGQLGKLPPLLSLSRGWGLFQKKISN